MKYIVSMTTALIVILSSTMSFGQLIFEKGQSGFGVSLQLSSAGNATFVGLGANYTSNGQISGGLAIARGSEMLDGINYKSTIIRPYVDFIALRQSDDMPISVGGAIAYQYNTYNNVDGLSGSIFDIFADISHTLHVNKDIRIIPCLSAAYSIESLSFQGNKIGERSGIRYILDATVAFKKFYIDPHLTFRDGNSSFGISAGVYFPK